MQLSEHFLQYSLPQDFYWFNEPKHYRLGNGLEIFTDEKRTFGKIHITAFKETMDTPC